MLNNICKSWNTLFTAHPSDLFVGSVTITEKGIDAKNKSLTIVCPEVVAFPSKQFDCFDLFSALSNRNCDSVLLVRNDEGSFDLVYVEMKSRFDSRECFEAKRQITETSAKIHSLFQMMKLYHALPIRKVYGVIEYQQLDGDQENLWLKMQQLPDDSLDFGWKLIKYGTLEGKTLFDQEMNMPSTMIFTILLSDKAHFTIDYSDICKRV